MPAFTGIKWQEWINILCLFHAYTHDMTSAWRIHPGPCMTSCSTICSRVQQSRWYLRGRASVISFIENISLHKNKEGENSTHPRTRPAVPAQPGRRKEMKVGEKQRKARRRRVTYGKVVAQQASIQCHAQGHCSTSAEWTSRRSNRGSAGSRGYSERQKCRRFRLQCEITACFLTRIVIAGLWDPNKKQMQQRDFIELVRDTEWKKKRKESRDGAVSVALTSRNLGRAHDKAKCSGGR